MQEWIYKEGWTALRDAQEQAIAPILAADSDVIIAAATAAGKTEAAFLPILTNLANAVPAAEIETSDPWQGHDPWADKAPKAPVGIQVLYLSPLKALINDQFDRLHDLSERIGVEVHRWHGDVNQSAKKRVLSDPSGVLLITPESLEAQFVNRGTQIPGLFAGLRFIVIDELHSFIATARGAQLQSLLNRVELAIRFKPPRIGLSATIGDMSVAAEFLQPRSSREVIEITSEGDQSALQMQLRGYEIQRAKRKSEAVATAEVAEEKDDHIQIGDDIFRKLRGQDNLVFANSRTLVERFADMLARRCEAERLPNEFFPHHGSLSKEVRESVESHLKDSTKPATAICTSTLEMGIDIGTVSSIAQVGPPPSVASLRQRLGRAGRRGDPAVLRLYIAEPESDERSPVVDELRCKIFRSTAMVQLMLNRWLEQPEDPGFNYSTLVQQILSTVAQHGGATAKELHSSLCGSAPFQLVDAIRLARLLRNMAAHDLIIQAGDGLLLPGVAGERFINHYEFFAAFQTSAEWRLVTGGRTLGSIPISHPLYEGVMLIFAGQRWRVLAIDSSAHVVELERASGGKPPNFGGGLPPVSDQVRREMRLLYRSSDIPTWLNPTAQRLLNEGRAAFERIGLSHSSVASDGSDLILFPWVGDGCLFTAMIALKLKDIDAQVEGPSLRIPEGARDTTAQSIEELLLDKRPSATDLARLIENREIEKWDWVLDDELSAESAGARLLDVDSAWTMLTGVLPDLKAQFA